MAIFEIGFWFTIILFDRPCSQIDEEIEDDDETSSSLGGSGGNSGLEDDSEMTYVNTLETKQVWGLALFHLPISSGMNPNYWIENWIRTLQYALPLLEVGVWQVWTGNGSVTYYRKSVCMVADLHKNLNILKKTSFGDVTVQVQKIIQTKLILLFSSKCLIGKDV